MRTMIDNEAITLYKVDDWTQYQGTRVRHEE